MRTSHMHHKRHRLNSKFSQGIFVYRDTAPLFGFHFIQRGGRSSIDKNVLTRHIEKAPAKHGVSSIVLQFLFSMSTQALLSCLSWRKTLEIVHMIPILIAWFRSFFYCVCIHSSSVWLSGLTRRAKNCARYTVECWHQLIVLKSLLIWTDSDM